MAAGRTEDPVRWRAMFDQAMTRIAGRFGRVEPRATARAHLLGLLSSVERKNCWQPAERAGHARPGRCSACCATPAGTRMPSATTSAPMPTKTWEPTAVSSSSTRPASSRRAGPRQGCGGSAPAPQDASRTARPACSWPYATQRGRPLIVRRLSLPGHSWCSDPERRRETRALSAFGQSGARQASTTAAPLAQPP